MDITLDELALHVGHLYLSQLNAQAVIVKLQAENDELKAQKSEPSDK